MLAFTSQIYKKNDQFICMIFFFDFSFYLFILQNKLGEFMCVVSGTLVSFLDTYNRDIPDIRSDESQFILSICGVVANIAAIPCGRHFIVSNTNGKDLLDQIFKALPKIPCVSGDPLKR